MTFDEFPFLDKAIEEGNKREEKRKAARAAWIALGLEIMIEWLIVAALFFTTPVAGIVAGILSVSFIGYRAYKGREVLRDLAKLAKYRTTL